MQAMIFCAGLGTRFKPWTDNHPKALAMINGKSLLQRNVEYLQTFGITDVIVNVHHFAGQIIEAIEKNKGWGSNIIISDETDVVLETGGGLLKAQSLFNPREKFITLNADVLTDLNLHRLLEYHDEEKPVATIAVGNRITTRNLLFDKNYRLCGWRNNATGEEKISVPMSNYVAKSYDCVAVFEYDIFDLIYFDEKFSLIDVYLDVARSHTILGYTHENDRWLDVGRPESVVIAEAMFS
ncbi:MAG: NTP transferase domain-containing protein [Sphingobacteriales bacterium]|jgi:MurNAc alpha-1-phosphate uridylyltransferase|nr:NTP transferase domain-containing protein [Sphingobacteriales bacterium]